ncbi:MAG: hypothetical protein IKY21_00970 [Clostridia bacterium]|nr:hypothetical protein [Clostridia bacterium]
MNNNEIKKTTAAENLMQLMSFTADKAMEMADASSVLGEATVIDGMTIIPVSKISAGFAGGGANMVNATVKKSNTPAGSGAKVTVTPISFLVIKEGEARVITVDAVPKDGKAGLIAKITEAVKSFAKKKKENK